MMFWSSVGQGLSTLSHWEVWVGILAIGGANLALLFAVGWIFASSRSVGGAASAMGFHMIGGPIIEATAITAFVVLLLPTLLGGDGFTPSEMAIALMPRAIKYGLCALLFVITLCFVPVVGQLITNVPGLATFLQGILILRPVSRLIITATLGKERMSNDVFPGFFACVGYFIVGLILTAIAFMLISVVADRIRQERDPVGHMLDQYGQEPTALQSLVGLFLGPSLGVIPLLMYGQHIAIGVQRIMATIPG